MTRQDDYWVERYTPRGAGFFDGLKTEIEKPRRKAPSRNLERKGPSLLERIAKWLNLG